MSQVKIYGLKKSLDKIKLQLSEVIDNSIVKELSFPKDKKYHRFIAFDEDDMIFPHAKSKQYTIIAVLLKIIILSLLK